MTKSYNSASNRNSEPENVNWWENKSNFPCMLTTGSDCQMMA